MGRKETRGIALGDEVAAQIVALRENDGSSASLTYTPPTGLGYWQPDPRTGASPFLSWATVTPWTMSSAAQFSPEPPPPIFGHLFARDLAELKAIGGTTSSVRTAEQGCIARFATDNPVAQYHRLARIVAEAVPSNLEHNARAFAVFSLALADAFISSFEAKFTYHFWRPWTAIQNAAAIGLPELQDPTWLSLIPTPAHPEYPANHAVQSGAIVTVLKHFYGTDIPPVTLTCQGAGCRADICPAAYTSGHLDDFEALFGVARIYGGLHYRNTIEVSWMQGEAIAQNIIRQLLRACGQRQLTRWVASLECCFCNLQNRQDGRETESLSLANFAESLSALAASVGRVSASVARPRWSCAPSEWGPVPVPMRHGRLRRWEPPQAPSAHTAVARSPR